MFGTVKQETLPVPEGVSRIVPQADTPRALLKTLQTCSMIVFDLATADLDELMLLVKVMSLTKFEKPTVFVVISSVMAWARTKKGPNDFEQVDEEAVRDEEDPEDLGPEMRPKTLTGQTFQKRMASGPFARWKTLETLVLSMNSKPNLRTFVVCAGLVYGCGERTLFDSMQASWLQQQTAQVLSVAGSMGRYSPAQDAKRLAEGNNYVPTVHVRDLARLIKHLVLGEVEETYLLCVDQSLARQQEIVRGIVDRVGVAGFVPPVVDATECKNDADYMGLMSLDVRMEPCSVMASEDFAWWAKDGLVANLETIANEFCRWRNLNPLRILLSGPPCSGKTVFAEKIAARYGLMHVRTADVLGAVLARAKQEVADAEAAGTDPEEPWGDMAAAGRLNLEQEVEAMREVLMRNICRYRGFVLDGYPRNHAGCDLFLSPAELDDEGNPVGERTRWPQCPEWCVVLDAAPETLRARAMATSEAEANGTHCNEADFERRLANYQAANQTQGQLSLADFFTDQGLELFTVQTDTLSFDGVEEAIRLFIEAKGRPWNNLPTERAICKAELEVTEADRIAQDAGEAQELQSHEAAEEAARAVRHGAEAERARELVESETRHLEAMGKPLKRYMQANVVPILTQGLLETCTVVPDDPVEFLAEYLFTHANDIEVQPLEG